MIAGIIKQVVSEGASPSLCLTSTHPRLTIAHSYGGKIMDSQWCLATISSLTSDQLEVCCCGVPLHDLLSLNCACAMSQILAALHLYIAMLLWACCVPNQL